MGSLLLGSLPGGSGDPGLVRLPFLLPCNSVYRHMLVPSAGFLPFASSCLVHTARTIHPGLCSVTTIVVPIPGWPRGKKGKQTGVSIQRPHGRAGRKDVRSPFASLHSRLHVTLAPPWKRRHVMPRDVRETVCTAKFRRKCIFLISHKGRTSSWRLMLTKRMLSEALICMQTAISQHHVQFRAFSVS